ncbi:IS110 family transposase [Nocardia transvalensis]|uniref:IS110 family transposase n=1 Tax=Nocardia transvalensis TaxID=37333 RepID=UPI001E44569E|nr:transposase [Nocardia transvalensis]
MTVIIGMDPHKRSATIEAIDGTGKVLRTGQYRTDAARYTEMLTMARRLGDRIWAIEGCNGIGRHLAHRLVHDGETVVDVPAKLSAQVRVFATGNGRKPTRSTRTRSRWRHCDRRICAGCTPIRN